MDSLELAKCYVECEQVYNKVMNGFWIGFRAYPQALHILSYYILSLLPEPESTRTVNVTKQISFQPSSAPVPSGYFVDDGSEFGPRREENIDVSGFRFVQESLSAKTARARTHART